MIFKFCFVPGAESMCWTFPCSTWLPSQAKRLLVVPSVTNLGSKIDEQLCESNKSDTKELICKIETNSKI
uniref:Uncharacterized protein n=1 Tax=Sus scrofa TaxID=9823 RepID=A0A8D0YZV6_PIG